MGDEPFLLAVAAIFGLIAVFWSVITIQAWAPAARRRGGYWYLEALFLLAGPVITLASAIEVRMEGAELAVRAGQAVTIFAAGLAALALYMAFAIPRKRIGRLIAAVIFFYLTFIFSGLAGIIPGMPLVYFVTPAIVLAFLCHGGYTYDWLLRTAVVNLRLLVMLSFAAIVFLPEQAFNAEESRTFFGIERLAGIAGHPNGLAALAALGLLLELRAGSRMFWKLPFIAALDLAQSSTGYIVAVAGLLILATHKRESVRWLLTLAGIVGLFAMLFAPRQTGVLFSSIVPENAATFTGRTRVWEAAMEGFYENPFWGYGPELLGDRFQSLYIPGAVFATHAHNQFVQTIAGQGLLGATALGLLFLALIAYAVRVRVRTDGLSLALVAFLFLRCVTETPLKPSGVGFGTLLIVLVVCLAAAAASEAEVPQRAEKPKYRDRQYERLAAQLAANERHSALANNQPRTGR